ncbi:hypothetical protein [Streptomyces mirabilis]|uniref:hypothetical protein n=1 Tax=Streptomyces mirabilis TaxID=68239 RepID=UPI00167ED7C3|nr:hypothetical protein [Streptomyces mirabilis]
MPALVHADAPREHFAKQLTALLRASGLTQTVAAEKASGERGRANERAVRITNRQISNWAKATNRPSETALLQLVRVLVKHARGERERLVREGKPVPVLPKGLLDEDSWAKWLRAAWDGAVPGSVPTVRDIDAEYLGVHRAVAASAPNGAGATDVRHAQLPPYLVREHDRQLRQTLTETVHGGPSVFALLLGESTTGKTRALYEAVLEQAPGHCLLHPADAEELQELLQNEAVVPGTVLWLNETQRYLDASSGQAIAKQLSRLLAKASGIVVVGAMWRTPHYSRLTAQGGRNDPGLVRDLLLGSRTVHLNVPMALTPDECEEFRAVGHADRRVIDALSAGTVDDGRVIQHLSGGPELLDGYRNQTLFTPVEHALITAALDARRLGHHQPIPSALLADAADGYMPPRRRSSKPDWADVALHELTCGYRDGDPEDRTDIRHALTALAVHVPRSGTPPLFEPADYLDQHTRYDRVDQLGPASLWQALLDHTSDPNTLVHLADAAFNRSLYKHAVRLSRKAVLAGSSHAGSRLIRRMAHLGLDQDHHAARWVAEHADVTTPYGAVWLLEALREVDAGPEMKVVARRAARAASLHEPSRAASLLDALREADAVEEAQAVARRAVKDADLTDLYGVRSLLKALREADAVEEAQAVARRAVKDADPADLYGVREEVRAFCAVDAVDEARAVVALVARRATVADPVRAAHLLRDLRAMGAVHDLRILADRAADGVDLNATELFYDSSIGMLLKELLESDVYHAAARLIHRIAAEADLTEPRRLPELLKMVREACSFTKARALDADRMGAAEYAADVLRTIGEVGIDDAISVLADRSTEETDLSYPRDIAHLLGVLREAGENEAARKVAIRATEQINLTLTAPYSVDALLRALREAGGDSKEVRQLADHAAKHARAQKLDPYLLEILLQHTRARDEVERLAGRAAREVDLTAPRSAVRVLRALREAGSGETDHLADRAAREVELADPDAIADLLRELRAGGVKRHVEHLAARAADGVSLTSTDRESSAPYFRDGLSSLLKELHRCDMRQEAARLIGRIATVGHLTNPRRAAHLLETLHEMGATETAHVAERAATQANPATDHGRHASDLLRALKAVGAREATRTFTYRTANAGVGERKLWGRHGREVTGRSAAAWSWQDLPPA